ncbi:MAG: NADH-quinone oxidoreductase subunit C [Candidatus Omnitrophota bacterium]
MVYQDLLKGIGEICGIQLLDVSERYHDEVYVSVQKEDFKKACIALHKYLRSPVMTQFALDNRQEQKVFVLYCGFMSIRYKKWVFVVTEIPADTAQFDSLSKELYSATLFEREIKEMFGIEPCNSPDTRSLRLHDEVWPRGQYPLRKDFKTGLSQANLLGEYAFAKVEGEGIFEVPVGPVHAGIIAPGHFRFSSAGEPIINLEIRLGFTHRGVEKLFEGKNIFEAIKLSECVAGDAAFGHSWSFCQAIEKNCGVTVPKNSSAARAILLELERMYNHVNDIGGIAIDVGFSFPAAYASLMKETILQLNEKITGSRYLKGANTIGGVNFDLNEEKKRLIKSSLGAFAKDFEELKNILFSSVSFMDRVDGTGILRKKTAEDFGVVGLCARASGIAADLRKDFTGIYDKVKFHSEKQETGDVLARLNLRILECEESMRLIEQFLRIVGGSENKILIRPQPKAGFALGYIESWRGPVLYWVKIDAQGFIERCKIVDPSFHNWPALAYAVLGNIIPDFPLCNKSFDLSYAGNDL